MLEQSDTTGGQSLNSLIMFRDGWYGCLDGWADTIFELCDAVLQTPGPVTSTPMLSLEPVFDRSHGALYKALAACEVDPESARDLLATHRPAGPLVFAVDASTWERPDAETSPGRGYYYSASKHTAGQPVAAGWCYQHVVALDGMQDSWTWPIDQVRLEPGQDLISVTVTQIQNIVSRLPANSDQTPVFVFDAGYNAPALTYELADTKAQIIVRIRDDRVFYTDPGPQPTGTTGRPRRHGQRLSCAKVHQWPKPDQHHTTHDPRYGNITVQTWTGLHPQLARRGHWTNFTELPIVPATIIKIDIQHLPKPPRMKQTLWLWVTGPGPINPDTIWRAYLRRFDIEHTFRYLKQTLGWTTPKIATPQQADTWTWTVLIAYAQLRLARPLVADIHLPWERPTKHSRHTPNRVRRGFRQLAPHLGTPASPPKPSKAGPGRPKGTPTGPRTRHPATKTTPTKV